MKNRTRYIFKNTQFARFYHLFAVIEDLVYPTQVGSILPPRPYRPLIVNLPQILRLECFVEHTLHEPSVEFFFQISI